MAVIPSPFSRRPRQSDTSDPWEQLSSNPLFGGGPTPKPEVRPSATPTPAPEPEAVSVPVADTTPSAPSGRDDSTIDLPLVSTSVSSPRADWAAYTPPTNVGDVYSAAVRAIGRDPMKASEVQTVAAGKKPGNDLFGRGMWWALGKMGIPQRGVQASLASVGESLQIVGDAPSRNVQAALSAAAAGKPIRDVTEDAGGLLPVPGKQTFQLPSTTRAQEIGVDRDWLDKVMDDTYYLTVPNIRDSVRPDTGIGWLDKALTAGLYATDFVIEGGFQGVTDPLSYFTFGAGKWAGQQGRAALAARLLQDDAVKATGRSILNNPQRIYRLGEWGLTKAERKALVNAGIMDEVGLSFAWGRQSTIGYTGALAKAVGKPTAYVRAWAGDVANVLGIPKLVTPKGRKSLQAAARSRIWWDSDYDGRRAIMNYAASQAAKRERGYTQQVLASRYRGLIRLLVDLPEEQRNQIARMIEPGSQAIPPANMTPQMQDLAAKVSAAFDDMRSFYNERMQQFRDKYNLDPDFALEIGDVENYFYHTLTPQANRYLRTIDQNNIPLLSSLADVVGVGAREMREGGGPLRARKLVAGEKWLDDRPLQYGSIDEINARWREVTGKDFDFFDTDAAAVMSSYIDSISSQSARIGFYDRLFDFGSDAIRPVLKKSVPDDKLLDKAVKKLAEIERQKVGVINKISKNVAAGEKATGNVVERIAKKVLDARAEDWVQAEQAMADAGVVYQRQLDDLNQLQAQAAAQSKTIGDKYDLILAPMKARIAALQKAIAEGVGAQEAARQELVKEHTKLFPNRKKRPTDIRELAREILGEKKNRFERQLKPLETRRSRAAQRAQSRARRAERLGQQIEEVPFPEDYAERTQRLRALADINYDTEVAPDGLFYTSESYLQSTPDGGAAPFQNSFDDIADPIAVPASDAEHTWRIADRLDDTQEMLTYLDDAVAETVLDLTQDQELADWVLTESRRLVQSRVGTEPDPRVPDILRPIIQIVDGWTRQKETSTEIVESYINSMAEAFQIIAEQAGTYPTDPEILVRLVDDTLYSAVRQASGPEAARLSLVVPDAVSGGDKILMDATETWNIYTGATDSPFYGMTPDSWAWDDAVPKRVVVEPTAAPKAAPAPTAPAVRATVEPATDATTKDVLRRNVWVSDKQRAEAINQLIADAKKATKAGNVDPVVAQLKDITDIGEKAQLVREALDAGTAGTRSPFFREVLERFQYEVEFAIGRAAAGIGTDNFSRSVQQAASADPDMFLRYTVEAANSASVKKPEKWAKIPKAEREQLEAAASGRAPTPAATAAAAPEPTTQVVSGPLDVEMQLAEELATAQQAARGLGERQAVAETQAAAARQQAGEAGREIGRLKGAQTRSEQAVRRRARTAQTPRVEVDGQPRTLGSLTKEGKQVQSEINKAERAFQNELRDDPILKQVPSAEKAADRAATQFDAAKAAFAAEDDWDNTIRPLYNQDINDIINANISAPPPGVAADIARQWVDRTTDVLANLRAADLTPQEINAWDRVYTQMFALEAKLADLDAQGLKQEVVVERIRDGLDGAKMVKDILEGWREIERMGVQIPKDLYDEIFSNVTKMTDPREWGKAVKWWFDYQRFFKAYAISTPGFFIRNTMTALWNNIVAGVDLDDTASFKFAFDYATKGLEAALDAVPAAKRQQYEEAIKAVVGSGGGQAIDEVQALVRGAGSRLYNNRYTRFFQRTNEAAEIAARMGMALDGVAKGYTLDQNTARIARYHFDYSDVSQLDLIAKSFIPFWTFASRNIQLQVVNQFARPGMYRRYEEMKRINEQYDTSGWPLWVRERDPIAIGGLTALDPDLPQVDLQQKLEMLTQPKRLLSQANPLLRAPLELTAGQSLAFDVPFSSRERPMGATDYLAAPLTEAIDLGFGSDLSSPTTGTISAAGQQLLPSMLPPLQQLQRYLKTGLGAAGYGPESTVQQTIGGEPKYAERDWLTTLGSYTGVPVRRFTPQQLESEMRRIIYELEQIGK